MYLVYWSTIGMFILLVAYQAGLNHLELLFWASKGIFSINKVLAYCINKMNLFSYNEEKNAFLTCVCFSGRERKFN